MPLCEAIYWEIEGEQRFGDTPYQNGVNDGLRKAQVITLDHFAALLNEAMAKALCGWRDGARSDTPFDDLSEAEKAAYCDQAQAVMQLFRKE